MGRMGFGTVSCIFLRRYAVCCRFCTILSLPNAAFPGKPKAQGTPPRNKTITERKLGTESTFGIAVAQRYGEDPEIQRAAKGGRAKGDLKMPPAQSVI